MLAVSKRGRRRIWKLFNNIVKSFSPNRFFIIILCFSLLPSITGTSGSTSQASYSQRSTLSTSEKKSKTIFVAAFHKWATEDEIREKFKWSKFEKFVWMSYEGSSKTNRNYCFITYKTIDKAESVIKKMHGADIFVTAEKGKQFCKLNVSFAQSKPINSCKKDSQV